MNVRTHFDLDFLVVCVNPISGSNKIGTWDMDSLKWIRSQASCRHLQRIVPSTKIKMMAGSHFPLYPRPIHVAISRVVDGTWCSSAKRENISFLIHLLRGLTRVTYTSNNSQLPHSIVSLTRNNTIRMLRKYLTRAYLFSHSLTPRTHSCYLHNQ